MNMFMQILTSVGAIAMLLAMCSIPALLVGGVLTNHNEKNDK